MEGITTPEEQQELENAFINMIIPKKDVFVFVATPFTMKNRERLYHCNVAAKYHKTMYACVKQGILSRIYWRKYRDFPWRRIYFFKTKQDLDFAIHDILVITKKEAKKLIKKKKEDDIAYA